MIGLQWMQRVEREDLDAHIAKMRQTYPDYQIFTVPKDQPKTFGYILENNTPVYVATDIYPRTQANLSLLGFTSLESVLI